MTADSGRRLGKATPSPASPLPRPRRLTSWRLSRRPRPPGATRNCGPGRFAEAYDWSAVSPALAAEYRRIVAGRNGGCTARTRRSDGFRRAHKLLRLLRTANCRAALRHGVAATIEHDGARFGYDFRSVIDVGAHRGQFSLFASARFPSAALWAIEPLAEPRARLVRGLAGKPAVTVDEKSVIEVRTAPLDELPAPTSPRPLLAERMRTFLRVLALAPRDRE